jgi:alpha-1,2-mannosyltransferase
MLTGCGLRPRTRWALIAVSLPIIAIHVAAVIHRRALHPGDFDVSREFGRRFLHAEYLYRGGLHFPYLPSAAMYFSPLAMMPAPIAFVISYCLAIACLPLIFMMLHAMIRGQSPMLESRGFLIAAAALLLGIHYLIRDLDDGGPNIILLAIIVTGSYCTWNRRESVGAVWLGLAAAIKATPGAFIPFFLLKRKWRAAIYTAAAAAFWIMLPMLRMGPSGWWNHQREWTITAVGFALGHNQAADYYYGSEHIQNQSLRAAVVHLLEKTSASAPMARSASIAAAVTLVAAFCWLMVSRSIGPYDPALLDFGGLLVLMLLLSPITWVQHMVLMIPALYLIAAEEIGIRQLGRVAAAAMLVFVALTLLLNREFIGAPRYHVLLDYHVHTLSMLIVLGVVMLLGVRRRLSSPA